MITLILIYLVPFEWAPATAIAITVAGALGITLAIGDDIVEKLIK